MVWSNVNGDFQVNTQKFKHGNKIRERPVAVRTFLKKSPTKRTVDCSLAALSGKGQSDGKIPHTEGGHLVALQMGGADSAYNLVPMYGGVNRGTYRAVERGIYELIGSKPEMAMQVNVSYPVSGDEQRIPSAFECHVFSGVTDLSKIVLTTETLVQRVDNTKLEPARIAITGDDIELRRRLIEIRDAFTPAMWKVEDYLGCNPEHLPALDKRPNAWLDWLIYTDTNIKTARELLSKFPIGEFTIGTQWRFVPVQRQFLAFVNQLTQPDSKKAGECWSDVGDADPVKTALTNLGTDDGVHIDHIFPETAGGWNVYSNAAVTSALYNKAKGSSMDIDS